MVLEGTSSESTSVESGLPHGTILDLLLFLYHINDLPSSCLLYREINTTQDHYTLQEAAGATDRHLGHALQCQQMLHL